jgi:hypothetical protein
MHGVMEIQQAALHHKFCKTIQFLHRMKELLFSFSMIPFLNRNDEKWPPLDKYNLPVKITFFHRWKLKYINYAK